MREHPIQIEVQKNISQIHILSFKLGHCNLQAVQVGERKFERFSYGKILLPGVKTVEPFDKELLKSIDLRGGDFGSSGGGALKSTTTNGHRSFRIVRVAELDGEFWK